MKFVLIIFSIFFTQNLYAQQFIDHKSYNEKNYGYGVPFTPIQTPRTWFPGQKPNHSHRFGLVPRYNGDAWFTYHYEIRF